MKSSAEARTLLPCLETQAAVFQADQGKGVREESRFKCTEDLLGISYGRTNVAYVNEIGQK